MPLYRKIATLGTHGVDHEEGGSDVIDGDKLDITWSPTYYDPDTSPSEVTVSGHLTAHLKGMDVDLSGLNAYKDTWFVAYRNGHRTITSSAATNLLCNAEEYDNGNNYDAVSNYDYTAPSDGYYMFIAQCDLDNISSTLYPYLDLWKDTGLRQPRSV